MVREGVVRVLYHSWARNAASSVGAPDPTIKLIPSVYQHTPLCETATGLRVREAGSIEVANGCRSGETVAISCGIEGVGVNGCIGEEVARCSREAGQAQLTQAVQQAQQALAQTTVGPSWAEASGEQEAVSCEATEGSSGEQEAVRCEATEGSSGEQKAVRCEATEGSNADADDTCCQCTQATSVPSEAEPILPAPRRVGGCLNRRSISPAQGERDSNSSTREKSDPPCQHDENEWS